MSLHGHRVLIVESKAAPLARSLKTAIARAGAEILVDREPVRALKHAGRADFSIAVVSTDHLAVVDQLGMPVVVYGSCPPPIAVTYVSAPVQRLELLLALERLLSIRSRCSLAPPVNMEQSVRQVSIKG